MTDRDIGHLWHDRTSRLLDMTRTALLDLVDIGPRDQVYGAVPHRRPDPWEISITRRGKNNDADYTPTQRHAGRNTSGPNDPTGNTILAIEATIQSVTTTVEQLVEGAAEIVLESRLPVHNNDGDLITGTTIAGDYATGRPHLPADLDPDPDLAQPQELGGDHANAIRTNHRGNDLVNMSPASCRRHILAGLTYAHAVSDSIANRATNDNELSHAWLADRASTLHTHIHRAWRATTGIMADPTEPTPPGYCADPLLRGCPRLLTSEDLARNRQDCTACRTAKSRRNAALNETA